MINFRFHLISLIAVFLALAVGVIMGYAVLGQPTVDTLQSRVDTVEARANEIRSENDRLRSEQARLEGLLEDLDQYAATSRLRGASVLPVAVRGVDGGRVGELVQLVRDAGGVAPGIVWLEGKWNLEDDEDATELATIVGSTSTAKAAIREDAARALTNRFLVGPPSGRPDPLIELDDAGFISFQEVGDTPFDPTRLDARSSRLVVIGGNGADVPFERATLPLAAAYAELGRLVAVVDEWTQLDPGPARGDELDAIRDTDLRDQIATTDNFDTVDGPLLAVLMLGDLDRGVIGHYGFGAGADRAAPEWWGV